MSDGLLLSKLSDFIEHCVELEQEIYQGQLRRINHLKLRAEVGESLVAVGLQWPVGWDQRGRISVKDVTVVL